MDCSGIPDNVNAGVSPNCVMPGATEITITVRATGFTLREQVSVGVVYPDSPLNVIDPYPRRSDPHGVFELRYIVAPDSTGYGLTETIITGKTSGNVARAYFKVIPPR
jgi:hypothetical protein